jgi:uncharacterized MAPEG superfamily protein
MDFLMLAKLVAATEGLATLLTFIGMLLTRPMTSSRTWVFLMSRYFFRCCYLVEIFLLRALWLLSLTLTQPFKVTIFTFAA